MNASDFFAQTYAEARGKFLAAAAVTGLAVQSHPHPLQGRDGELLAMDVARFGPADARAVLLVSSACHGVEGFCGSGVQNALLADPDFHTAAATAGVAVLYIHALNPHGFSWWRRTTHENVDLNRNWQDFSQPLPENRDYDDLAHLLVPPTWPPSDEVRAGIAAFVAQRGAKALQTAVSGGQYKHPQGLFYGGRNPTWSRQTLGHVLAEHGSRCARLGWIDVHTGLGPNGHGERINANRQDTAALSRARAWWGAEVTSIHDGSSTSAVITGMIWGAVYEHCSQADYTGIAMEYGTVPIPDVIDALRADQWLENHPEAPEIQRLSIKQQIRDAFYTDTDAWKQRIVQQGVESAWQGLAGLSMA